jgi:hypothetical protein
MEKVLDLIDTLKFESDNLYRKSKNDSHRLFYLGIQATLIKIKNEILKEAVVCGRERNQTICDPISMSSDSNKNVAQYCVKCKKEFDFFGKEISS